MDNVELECWDFVKQQIQRKIYFYSTQLGLQPLSTQVIDAVVNYFLAGSPVYNQFPDRGCPTGTGHPPCALPILR